jgi:hypothetical protein
VRALQKLGQIAGEMLEHDHSELHSGGKRKTLSCLPCEAFLLKRDNHACVDLHGDASHAA